MTDLELQKTALEVRKGIVTAVHGAKAGIRAVPCPLLMYLLICILKR